MILGKDINDCILALVLAEWVRFKLNFTVHSVYLCTVIMLSCLKFALVDVGQSGLILGLPSKFLLQGDRKMLVLTDRETHKVSYYRARIRIRYSITFCVLLHSLKIIMLDNIYRYFSEFFFRYFSDQQLGFLDSK